MIWRSTAVEPAFIKVAAGAASAGAAAVGWTFDGISVSWLGVPLSTVLMAFAGSVISLTWIKTQRKWYIVVAAGTVFGSVCAPLVAWALGIEAARALVLEKAIAFALGLTVQTALPTLLDWIRRKGGA